MTTEEFQNLDPIKKLDFSEDVAQALYEKCKSLQSDYDQLSRIAERMAFLINDTLDKPEPVNNCHDLFEILAAYEAFKKGKSN